MTYIVFTISIALLLMFLRRYFPVKNVPYECKFGKGG